MKHYIKCDPKGATHLAFPLHERNTIDLSEPSVKIKPFTPPSEGEIRSLLDQWDVQPPASSPQITALPGGWLRESPHVYKRYLTAAILSLWGGKNQNDETNR
jgi:hypothetical protein